MSSGLSGGAELPDCQSLPARLDHARNLAVEGELAEAQAANPELAQEGARPSAAPAPVPVPGGQFRGAGLVLRLGLQRIPADLIQFQVFRDLCGRSHLNPYSFLLP